VKSLFTKYISPVLAPVMLTMGALLLSACGASVTEVANLPNGGTVTAVVSPSRVVAGQIYTYEAKSSSGTTVTWSWGDGSPDTVGSTVQKVWNRPGSQTITLSATSANSKAAVTQSVVVTSQPVAAGGFHTCALQPGGTVSCWGDNTYSQLGNSGVRGSVTGTVAVTGLTDAIALTAGGQHTCALKANGSVLCWGDNRNGQIGDGTISDIRANATVVMGLTDAVAISAGDIHTCAIKANTSVVCWGDNSYSGQLGDGTTATRVITTAVTGLTDAVAIGAGDAHTCVLKASGAVVCWGNNNRGQIGDGTKGNIRTATVAITGLTDVVALSGGDVHTCALKANGSVACWGGNSSGALGDGTTIDKLIPTAVTGLTDAIAITADGNFIDGVRSTDRSCAVKANGNVACWGDISYDSTGNVPAKNQLTPTIIAGLTSTVALSAGGNHNCALKANGAISCWGNNLLGQLGDGSIGIKTNLVAVTGPSGSTGLLTDTLQISAGSGHTCALINDGKVLCWGYNQSGQLGSPALTVGGVQANPIPTVVIDLGTNTKQITGGYGHTCALKNDGKLLCWGYNQYGQLGNATLTLLGQANPTPTVVVDLGTDTKQISAGNTHTCALKNDGTVLCWGSNRFGELGNPALVVGTQANPTPTAVIGLGTDTKQISAGSSYTCALKNDGQVLCWGLNNTGQLGIIDATAAVQGNPTPTVVMGLGTDTKQITASVQQTCALKNDGAVLCWGDNLYGQLGNSVTVGGQFNPTPTAVIGLGTNTRQVTIGFGHTCALKDDGKVLCWGRNQFGELGNPALVVGAQANPTPTAVVGLDGTNIQQIGAGSSHTCALKTNGKVVCWGNYGVGELGAPGNPPAFIDLSIKPEPTPVLGGSVFWR
jgi:alpha-tubulin suppressor-like RCC1 family protein